VALGHFDFSLAEMNELEGAPPLALFLKGGLLRSNATQLQIFPDSALGSIGHPGQQLSAFCRAEWNDRAEISAEVWFL
jgi:hypothetical protein